MSGRTLGRLGAVVALVAVAALAAGLLDADSFSVLGDYQWGAPAASEVSVDIAR